MQDKRCAPCCDDQLPVIATVGRGPKGDSTHVRVGEPDSCTETYVEGWTEDSDTGEVIVGSEWRTLNINGGELKYQYNLRPYTNPRTFTITFVYKRPGRHEWSWTTPAIPYIWSLDKNGEIDPADHIVGSGVATLFVKTMHTDWNERLHYPIDPDTGNPFPREDFNAPEAKEAWSSTITFGHGGDIDVPDFDDIAKIIGISKEDVYNILNDNSITINGIDARNLIEYIDKCDRRDRDHFHKDLGFNSEGHGPNTFGPSPITNQSYSNVKQYIDAADENLRDRIKRLEDKLDDLGVNDIPSGKKIAYGNINLLSPDTSMSIMTHTGTNTGDVRAR